MSIPRLTISPLPDILVNDTLPLERLTNYEYKKAEQIVEFARHTGSLVVYVVDYSISHPYNIEFCTLLFKQKDKDHALSIAGQHGTFVNEYNFGKLKDMRYEDMVETFRDKPHYDIISDLWKDLNSH